MTHDDRPLERAARSWIEAGPTQAPDRAVDDALRRIQTIPQERELRLPWRPPTMLTNRLGIAAAVAVVLVVGVLGFSRLGTLTGQGGPSPSPTVVPTVAPSPSKVPVASPTPLASFAVHAGPAEFTQVAVSDVYLYGLRYPGTWTLRRGTYRNEPDAIPEIGAGRNDFYGDSKSSGIYVTAGPLSSLNPDLATFSSYIAASLPSDYSMYSGAGCTHANRALVLDGEPAQEADFSCPGGTALWVTAIHHGLAYQVAWLDDGGKQLSELQPKLDQFLQSFTFAP